jgi:hypothetical protein
MLLQIRRPVRPNPRPLRERDGSDVVTGVASIWLAVRQKRGRGPVMSGRSKIWSQRGDRPSRPADNRRS